MRLGSLFLKDLQNPGLFALENSIFDNYSIHYCYYIQLMTSSRGIRSGLVEENDLLEAFGGAGAKQFDSFRVGFTAKTNLRSGF